MMFIHCKLSRRSLVFLACALALTGCASTAVQQGSIADRKENAVIAAGTNMRFAHVLETPTKPAAIWRAWTNVGQWGQWDGGLKSATLDGAFAPGASGRIVPLSGPEATFVISAVEPGQRYTFETALPLGTLVVTRRFLPPAPSGNTRFTHEVAFQGPLGWFWATMFGPGFRRELPPTMARLATYAGSLR